MMKKLIKENRELFIKMNNYILFYEGYLHEIIRVCSGKIAIYNWRIRKISTFEDCVKYEFSIQSNLGLEYSKDKKIEEVINELKNVVDFLVIPVEYLYYRESSGEFIFVFMLPNDWAKDKMEQMQRDIDFRENRGV